MATKYEKSVAATEAVRPEVKPALHALFDHLVRLAEDSHAHGNFKRAGRELLAARRLAKK